MARKKIEIDDTGATGQKYKVMYDNELVTMSAYNDNFKFKVSIPTSIFCVMAIDIQDQYIRGELHDDD